MQIDALCEGRCVILAPSALAVRAGRQDSLALLAVMTPERKKDTVKKNDQIRSAYRGVIVWNQ